MYSFDKLPTLSGLLRPKPSMKSNILATPHKESTTPAKAPKNKIDEINR
jgi:hypothetical protein